MVGNKLNKVTIITSAAFPNGFAPTSRILSYCQGFVENRYSPEVVVICPNLNKENRSFSPSGFYNGYEYKYPFGFIHASNNKFVYYIQQIYSRLLSLAYIIFKYFLLKRSSFIIFYGVHPIIELVLIAFAKIFKVKIFKEESENPDIRFRDMNSYPTWLLKFLYMKILYKNYNKVLVMTNALETYFQEKGILNTVVINHAISMQCVFDNDTKSAKAEYYAFIGSLNDKKDGCLNLLEALGTVKKIYPSILLKIAGFGDKDDMRIFHSKIEQLDLANNICFLGKLPLSKAHELIREATGLISSRPESMQAKYGFPTKIVEYLATGNPIITTATGDLKLYLIDKVNSFVLQTNTPNEIAERWLEVIENPELAKSIGLEGLDLVKQVFSPRKQTKKIIQLSV